MANDERGKIVEEIEKISHEIERTQVQPINTVNDQMQAELCQLQADLRHTESVRHELEAELQSKEKSLFTFFHSIFRNIFATLTIGRLDAGVRS